MAWRSRPNLVELDATKIPSVIDIAWSAGIFEGEGTVRMCGRGKRSLAVAVVQKDPEILIRMREWFGGSVCGPNSNSVFVWNICGDRARIFVALIHSYLSARRKIQVDMTDALEFLNGKSPEGLTVEDLGLHLAAFYEERRSNTWYGTNRNEVRKANYRKRKLEDPEFLPKLLAKNSEWRARQAAIKESEGKG
jgi:hypothetical protein